MEINVRFNKSFRHSKQAVARMPYLWRPSIRSTLRCAFVWRVSWVL